MTALKYMISDQPQPIDPLLHSCIGDFLATIGDADLVCWDGGTGANCCSTFYIRVGCILCGLECVHSVCGVNARLLVLAMFEY